MKQFFIDSLALTTLFSSLLVITSKNPVISVVYLISVFINAAGYLILTGVHFLGISYIVIYVGAITVLFLFVIMLLNINLEEIVEVGNQYTKNIPLAFTITFLFIYILVNLLPSFNVSIFSTLLQLITNLNSFFWSDSLNNNILGAVEVFITFNPMVADTLLLSFTQIEALGHIFYTDSAVLLLVTSFILLLSMIGPIFLHVSNSQSSITLKKSKNLNNLILKPSPKSYNFNPLIKKSLIKKISILKNLEILSTLNLILFFTAIIILYFSFLDPYKIIMIILSGALHALIFKYLDRILNKITDRFFIKYIVTAVVNLLFIFF